MANERINLYFREFSPDKAESAVRIARDFAVSKPDGKPHPARGTVYRGGGYRWLAYWTPNRTVVVRELEEVTRGND